MSSVEHLVEVYLNKSDDFLKVRETLTRIGVSAKNANTLYQSCHILHKQGKYYIVHFKEMFALDGKQTDITENDYARRNTITNLLAEWNLVTIADSERTKFPEPAPLSQIKVLSHKDKANWNLETKYTIGKKRKTQD